MDNTVARIRELASSIKMHRGLPVVASLDLWVQAAMRSALLVSTKRSAERTGNAKQTRLARQPANVSKHGKAIPVSTIVQALAATRCALEMASAAMMSKKRLLSASVTMVSSERTVLLPAQKMTRGGCAPAMVSAPQTSKRRPSVSARRDSWEATAHSSASVICWAVCVVVTSKVPVRWTVKRVLHNVNASKVSWGLTAMSSAPQLMALYAVAKALASLTQS